MFFAFEVLAKAEKMQKNKYGFHTALELARLSALKNLVWMTKLTVNQV
jgi:hypothetical protein